MVRKGFALGVALVALLVILWATGGVVAGSPSEGPGGDVSIAATVSSKISYQGVLKENGSPVTGSRDMTFRLYSDSGCTTQVGSDIVKSGVQVTNGLFSVDLAVTQSHFNGQGLWLEVEVGGTKIGCQEILPVPYALSLRPGAIISGTCGDTASINADNWASGGTGVSGRALATSGTTYGVLGQSDSTAGTGVYGYATAESGTTYGVYGRADNSTGGVGVYGIGGGVGVYGRGKNAVIGISEEPGWAAVFGRNTATTGTGYGVYGRSDSPEGYGVYGRSNYVGVYGYGSTAAIYGDGDVKQTRIGNGLVKAAAYTYCSICMSCQPQRYFNNVNAVPVACICGGSVGHCTIDFGFQISDRFWVATAVGDSDLGVSCKLGSANDQLDCFHYDASNGSGKDGYIMVLIY